MVFVMVLDLMTDCGYWLEPMKVYEMETSKDPLMGKLLVYSISMAQVISSAPESWGVMLGLDQYNFHMQLDICF